MRFGIAFVVCWKYLKRLILVGSRRGALEFDAIYAFVRNFGSSFPPPFLDFNHLGFSSPVHIFVRLGEFLSCAGIVQSESSLLVVAAVHLD